jgi:hypothetical protein
VIFGKSLINGGFSEHRKQFWVIIFPCQAILKIVSPFPARSHTLRAHFGSDLYEILAVLENSLPEEFLLGGAPFFEESERFVDPLVVDGPINWSFEC